MGISRITAFVFVFASVFALLPEYAHATSKKACVLTYVASDGSQSEQKEEWIQLKDGNLYINGTHRTLPASVARAESYSKLDQPPPPETPAGYKQVVTRDSYGLTNNESPVLINDPKFDPYIMGSVDASTPIREKRPSRRFKMDLKGFRIKKFLNRKYAELLAKYPKMDIALNHYALRLKEAGALDHHMLTLIGTGGFSRSYARHPAPDHLMLGNTKHALSQAFDVVKVRRIGGNPETMANDFILDLLMASLVKELAPYFFHDNRPLFKAEPIQVTPRSFKAGVAYQSALKGENYMSIANRLKEIKDPKHLSDEDRAYLDSIGAKDVASLKEEIQDLEYFFWITQREILEWTRENEVYDRTNVLYNTPESEWTDISIGLDMNHGENLIRAPDGVTHLFDP